jgi:hypothetical protein
MKKRQSPRDLEEARESEQAVKSPSYIRSIKQARADVKTGRVRTYREVFEMDKIAKKKAEVVLSVVLGASDLAGLRMMARKRKRSVDSLASSIIRQYAQGRLV